jgi:hypothetical protein
MSDSQVNLDRFRTRLTAFYQKYSPERIESIENTVQTYRFHEEPFFEALTKMYGPEPDSNGAESSASPPPPSQPKNDYHARVTAMYEKYAPEKVGNVQKVLAAYVDQEHELMEHLVRKYGPEPVVVQQQQKEHAEVSDEPKFSDD